MPPSILGIHHVTAITADAQKNIDFYTGVLGLRLVKLTVNFDDPSSYHLYYGDASGSPGSILTFFAWPGAREGRQGPPQVTVTAFAAKRGTLERWQERLRGNGVAINEPMKRFGADVLPFADPDGMRLEIVFDSDAGQDDRLERFHSATIAEIGYEHTAKLLTETMGFHRVGDEGNRFRFAVGDGGARQVVDILCLPGGRSGSMGAGAVHHIAWRTPDDAQQAAWREKLAALNFNVSPVMDRNYFHSIYFREPGGVLFEIATDPPGFTADEPAETLGSRLMLPPWLELHRAEIQKLLPPVRLPEWKSR